VNSRVLVCALIFVQLLLCLSPGAGAAPRYYEYTFETLKANVPERVNEVATKGWEVFDVAFTNLSGYLICYRRLVPDGSPQNRYAFDLATPDNAAAKANEAARNGWELYKLVSCAGRLYGLCYRGVPPNVHHEYAFERAAGAQLEQKANDASRRGWEVLDVGFGDVSGYLLCYRRLPPDAPRPTYAFETPRGADLQNVANVSATLGWELIRVLSCLQDRYCLCFRKASPGAHAYAFEGAAGKNIERLADNAVKNGWEVYRVCGSPAGDIDYSDAPDILRSAAPYLVCYRR
jgi:hypothetical protein